MAENRYIRNARGGLVENPNAPKWINAEQRAKGKRRSKLADMARRGITFDDLEMGKILDRALANPQGGEKDELFRILTGETSDLPFTPQQKQFALDNLGGDSVGRKIGDPYKNKEVLKLFAQFNPGDRYFNALYAGLGGK